MPNNLSPRKALFIIIVRRYNAPVCVEFFAFQLSTRRVQFYLGKLMFWVSIYLRIVSGTTSYGHVKKAVSCGLAF